MKLCRYFDENGYQSLASPELKVASFKELNDPFENSPFIKGKDFKPTDLKKLLNCPVRIVSHMSNFMMLMYTQKNLSSFINHWRNFRTSGQPRNILISAWMPCERQCPPYYQPNKLPLL